MALHDYDHIKHHDRIVRVYYDAIIELVLQYGVEPITVKMILDKTNTARQTFYNYFPDKFSLINYVFYHDVMNIYHKHYNFSFFQGNATLILWQHYNKRKFYQKLFLYKGQNNFTEWFKEFWREVFCEEGRRFYGDKYNMQIEYQLSAYTLGLSDMVRNWILGDCASCTPEELGQVCADIIPEPLMAIMVGNMEGGKYTE